MNLFSGAGVESTVVSLSKNSNECIFNSLASLSEGRTDVVRKCLVLVKTYKTNLHKTLGAAFVKTFSSPGSHMFVLVS